MQTIKKLDGKRKRKGFAHANHPLRDQALSEQDYAFALNYLKHGNATKAVIEAKIPLRGTPANILAARIKDKPKVKEFLHETRKKLSMEAEDIVLGLSIIASASVDDFVEFDEEKKTIKMNLGKAKELGMAGALKKATFDIHGNIIIELHNKLEAFQQLAKIYGLVKDDNSSSAFTDFFKKLVEERAKKVVDGTDDKRDSEPEPDTSI